MPNNKPESAFCVECGDELLESNRFCGKCGEPVARPPTGGSKSSHHQNQQVLPSLYYGLIQLCCGIVLVCFFLPWLDFGLAGPSGWDIVSSEFSWHVFLVVTPPLAAIVVSLLLRLLYRDPTRIKTYFTWIEIVSSLPLLSFVVIVILISREYGMGSYKAIFDNLLDIVKVVGIGGWGTVLGLVGVDVLTSRLYKEGLLNLGMVSEDDIGEPGLIEQVHDAIIEQREKHYIPGSASSDDIQRIREKIKQDIPLNPTDCLICDEKLSDGWKTGTECSQTGLCRDCFSSYLSRLRSI